MSTRLPASHDNVRHVRLVGPLGTADGEAGPMRQRYDFKLAPSLIHGVGVFAVRVFLKGEILNLFKIGDWSTYKPNELPEGILRHAIEEDGEIVGPADFHCMSVGWYLNDSKTANVERQPFSGGYRAMR